MSQRTQKASLIWINIKAFQFSLEMQLTFMITLTPSLVLRTYIIAPYFQTRHLVQPLGNVQILDVWSSGVRNRFESECFVQPDRCSDRLECAQFDVLHFQLLPAA